jgi:flagellar basal body-associated protein FliL
LKIISLKLLIICFMIGFGIFFAMDIVNKGGSKQTAAETSSADVQSTPVVGPHAVNLAPTQKPKVVKTTAAQGSNLGPMTAATAREKAAEAQLKQASTEQEEQPVITLQDSFVNRITNKIGDVLRRLATAIIDTIVTLFKMILG